MAEKKSRKIVRGVKKVGGYTTKAVTAPVKVAHKATKSSVTKLKKVAKVAVSLAGKRTAARMTPEELMNKALVYHSQPKPGKIEINTTKPTNNAHDLSLAYSPGVAIPCAKIEQRPETVYKYTGKGNLVGIISNGTAVLGLGNIGPLASKPVMEGKAMLFKKFANVNVFDIEVDTESVDTFIQTVKCIAPTFGAINLEDIAAPNCFTIEERLRHELDIPVVHDDQSGTAVVVCAALHNALEIQNKKACDIKIVCVGAGAAGIGILRLCREYFGCSLEQFSLVDSKGLVTVDRPDLSIYKLPYASPSSDDDSLAKIIKGADVLLGVSKKNLFTQSMIASMAPNPIIFAMANPDPEITPEKVQAVRKDAIIATGRSDYPNQVNNSVCFPYLFRGALDAKAKQFTTPMLHAAISSIAGVTHKKVPAVVKRGYAEGRNLKFGPNYILPKQNDPRLFKIVSTAIRDAYNESDIQKA